MSGFNPRLPSVGDPMARTWLVQRLERPFEGRFPDNPFSFGGGYKNGGLSAQAMDLIRPIFGFDYMGAAEFEFGAVPAALGAIAASAPAGLRAGEIQLTEGDVATEKDWRSKKRPTPELPLRITTLFYLCRDPHEVEVIGRIEAMAKSKGDLKEPTHLSSVLREKADEEYPSRVRGWLELNNGFLFFADRDMWAKTCALFGVTVEVAA